MPDTDTTIEVADWDALPGTPLVSVYMLAYRHEPFIAQAIEGVVAQKCGFPIELIIGEDCSPDRCREIALDYQKRHPQLIRVLMTGRNLGGTANARRCQSSARGDYIAICEGDDYWTDPTKLARQVALMQRNQDCSMVFHAARLLDASTGTIVGSTRWPIGSRQFSLSDLISGDGGMVPTASILAKREVVLDRPAWADHSPTGDYALTIKAALHGKVIYLDRAMSIYRIHVPHSWTTRQAPAFSARLAHAGKVEKMLRALAAGSGQEVERAVRYTISKYYSDIVVKPGGTARERSETYDRIRDKLYGSDRVLAWLGAKRGIRLASVKSLIRKSRTLTRLIRSQFNHRV